MATPTPETITKRLCFLVKELSLLLEHTEGQKYISIPRGYYEAWRTELAQVICLCHHLHRWEK